MERKIIFNLQEKSLNSKEVYGKVLGLLNQGYRIEEISKELIQKLLEDPYYSYDLIKLLIKSQGYKISEIPKELIQSVSRNTNISYRLVMFLIEKYEYKLIEIPQELFVGIYKDIYVFQGFIEELIGIGYIWKDMSFELKQKILENASCSYHLMRFLIEQKYKLSEIPKELIESVSKDNYLSYLSVKFLIEKQNYKLSEIPLQLIQATVKLKEYKKSFLDLVHQIKSGRIY